MATTLLALALAGALGFGLNNVRPIIIVVIAVAIIAQPAGFLAGAAGMILLRYCRRIPP